MHTQKNAKYEFLGVRYSGGNRELLQGGRYKSLGSFVTANGNYKEINTDRDKFETK